MNFKPLCFVDMPFGQKPDLKSGVVVDFDQICCEAIKHTTVGGKPKRVALPSRSPLELLKLLKAELHPAV